MVGLALFVFPPFCLSSSSSFLFRIRSTNPIPSGECAQHFQSILSQYPPQVSSRTSAAGWGCHVHNEVNKSLKKPLFDCTNLGDFYDCGCADGPADEKEENDKKKAGKVAEGAAGEAAANPEAAVAGKQKEETTTTTTTGQVGVEGAGKGETPLELEKEG